uniref:Secreted protein n=1 Tax=Elaeophora elaphi TaxID=1147741 RepID=A0A0R3S7G7_9BILA
MNVSSMLICLGGTLMVAYEIHLSNRKPRRPCDLLISYTECFIIRSPLILGSLNMHTSVLTFFIERLFATINEGSRRLDERDQILDINLILQIEPLREAKEYLYYCYNDNRAVVFRRSGAYLLRHRTGVTSEVVHLKKKKFLNLLLKFYMTSCDILLIEAVCWDVLLIDAGFVREDYKAIVNIHRISQVEWLTS